MSPFLEWEGRVASGQYEPFSGATRRGSAATHPLELTIIQEISQLLIQHSSQFRL